MEQIVLEVKDIALAILESKPPQLAITAYGAVPTAAYTNPRLVPFIYIQPPPDGIYDFSFLATPPSGPAAQVISPVVASHVMNPLPADCKGVRVHASINKLEALIDPQRPKEITF